MITLTEDEAAQITGERDPRAACLHLLLRPGAVTRWVIVKLGAKGALLAEAPPRGIMSHLSERDVRFVQQPAFSVPVEDTVGCGDSFAAAVRKFLGHSDLAFRTLHRFAVEMLRHARTPRAS